MTAVDSLTRKQSASPNAGTSGCVSAVFMRDIYAAVTPSVTGGDRIEPDSLRDACEEHLLPQMNDRHELEELIKRWRSKQQARQSYLKNTVFDSKTKKMRIRANAKDRSAAMPGLRKEKKSG